MRRPFGQFRGFTLIELILVLAIMATLAAMAAPSMRGWSKGAKLRDATDQLVAASRAARSEAISSATVHLLEVNDSGLSFRLIAKTDEGDRPAAGAFGTETTVSEHLRMRIIRTDGVEGPIAFFPDGRVTPGAIRVDAEWGETVEVVARTPAALFQVVAGGMQ